MQMPTQERPKSQTRQAFENVLTSKEARQHLQDRAEEISGHVDDVLFRVRDVGHTTVHVGSHLFAAIGILSGSIQGLELATGHGGSVETAITSLIFSVGVLKLGQFVERKREELRHHYEMRRALRPPKIENVEARPRQGHGRPAGADWIIDGQGHVVRSGADPRVPDIDAVWPVRPEAATTEMAALSEAPTETFEAPETAEVAESPGHDLWGDL